MKRVSQKAAIVEESLTTPEPSYSSFSRSFIPSATKSSYTPILVVLLLVASFLLGMLFNKVQYLEKGGTKVLGENTQNNNNTQPTNNAPAGGTAPAPGTKVNVADGHLPSLGDKNAKVKLIEFSDFQCPFCKKYFDETFAELKTEYIDTGKIVVYFRHYPLSFHPAAQPAAEAAECANDQGKFWEFHDEVFKNQDKISDGNAENTKTALKGFAEALGLNMDEFNSCFDSGKHKEAVTKDQADGTTAGVSGTPSFYVNGVQLVGAQPFSAFKTQIDAELAK